MLNIQVVTKNEPYKYLGIEFNEKGIDEKTTRKRIIEEIKVKLENIKKSNIGGLNLIKMINVEIISKLRYSFGIMYWDKTTLTKLDTMILSYIESVKLKYRASTKWRMYLPTKQGGLGLKSIRLVYLQEIINFKKAVNKKEEIEKMYKAYEETICKRKRIEEQIIDISKSIGINSEELIMKIANNEDTDKWIKQEAHKFYIEQWKKLRSAGQFCKVLNKEEVDLKTTTEAWDKLGLNNIQIATIVAYQEGTSIIGKRLSIVAKDPRLKKCYMCYKDEQTIAHVLTNCPSRRGEYIKRHDEVGKEVYKAILIKYGIIQTKQIEPLTIENEKVKVIWNQVVIKGKNKGRQPDITVINKEKSHGIIIDISVVGKYRLDKAYKEKLEEYKDTSLSIKQAHGLRTIQTIPVIITIDGLIHKKTTLEIIKAGIEVDWNKAIREVLYINQEMIIRCYAQKPKCIERGEKAARTRYRGVHSSSMQTSTYHED